MDTGKRFPIPDADPAQKAYFFRRLTSLILFREIITADGFRGNSFFRRQFDRGQEEMMKQTPFQGIEIFQEGNHLEAVQAIISQPLPYLGPFFILRGHCGLYDGLGFG